MEEKEVLDLMKSSRSKKEWNANCDKVKKACGGYPDYWHQKVILGGLMSFSVLAFVLIWVF